MLHSLPLSLSHMLQHTQPRALVFCKVSPHPHSHLTDEMNFLADSSPQNFILWWESLLTTTGFWNHKSSACSLGRELGKVLQEFSNS